MMHPHRAIVASAAAAIGQRDEMVCLRSMRMGTGATSHYVRYRPAPGTGKYENFTISVITPTGPYCFHEPRASASGCTVVTTHRFLTVAARRAQFDPRRSRHDLVGLPLQG